jgi:hypothetical protein
MLKQMYGEEVMSTSCASEWHEVFSAGRYEVEFDSQPGYQKHKN